MRELGERGRGEGVRELGERGREKGEEDEESEKERGGKGEGCQQFKSNSCDFEKCMQHKYSRALHELTTSAR